MINKRIINNQENKIQFELKSNFNPIAEDREREDLTLKKLRENINGVENIEINTYRYTNFKNLNLVFNLHNNINDKTSSFNKKFIPLYGQTDTDFLKNNFFNSVFVLDYFNSTEIATQTLLSRSIIPNSKSKLLPDGLRESVIEKNTWCDLGNKVNIPKYHDSSEVFVRARFYCAKTDPALNGLYFFANAAFTNKDYITFDPSDEYIKLNLDSTDNTYTIDSSYINNVNSNTDEINFWHLLL